MTNTNARVFDQSATAARFLLGGIGTGNISVDQCGALRDFELYGRPNKGFDSPYTFFAIRTEGDDGEVKAKALEAQKQPPFTGSHGFNAWETGGMARFARSQMHADYPFVTVRLEDDTMPVVAEMEAFTPFIPLATDDSSLPGFYLRWRVRNTSAQKLRVSVAGSFANLCDYIETNVWSLPQFGPNGRNTAINRSDSSGLHFTTVGCTENDLDFMDMAIVTPSADATLLPYWNEGSWWDGLQDFWNDFIADGRLESGRTSSAEGNNMHKSNLKIGSLCVQKEIDPGAEADFEFIVSWQRPNRICSWEQTPEMLKNGRGLIRNYSARLGSAANVAEYMLNNHSRLYDGSKAFARTLYGGSLPAEVVDALASTLTVIRSSTCFRVEDGTFFGYEGCFDDNGCCDGNCTHVWNYTQSLAYLFPELERSMRRTEFLCETDENGRMTFRARRYLGDEPWELPPAVDGQLGSVVRLYRDWKLCGDDAFLRELWPSAKKALEFAFTCWDSDGDGVLDSQQHNTYDIEFYGMSSMLNSIWFAALRAGEEICRYLGDGACADRYVSVLEKAAKILDEKTFNGEYYIQLCKDIDSYKYQYGTGCLSDQLLGQQQAHLCGLGYILPEKHVKSALKAICRYNFKYNFNDFNNLQRTYALNGDAGLILCSWPLGGRPEYPFVYSDEVWSGIEYQVAAHLICEDMVEEGLKIVRAVRERHNGIKRSPWDEVECGHHYARSLASYGLLIALSGFCCDAVNKELHFSPKTDSDSFSSFFSCGDGWGMFHMTVDPSTGGRSGCIETLYGDLSKYKVTVA